MACFLLRLHLPNQDERQASGATEGGVAMALVPAKKTSAVGASHLCILRVAMAT